MHDLWSVVRSPEFEPRTRLYIDVAFMAFLLDAPRAVVDLADAVAPWADDQPCLTRV
ncbi:hypothetical protein [Nocardioides sp.]|uniref:hypothetical protein n=1 Tax=Nocardioides sp. TaxID=35761 RepID=UPI00286E1473|nr:hypothetical protein [Nocardioides sp.]